MITSLAVSVASAQYSAVRVNTAGLATGTLNVGVDVAVAGQWSVEACGYWNPIATKTLRIDATMVSAGARWWRFEPHVGRFVGFHAATILYDAGGKDSHYKGWMAGVGASYGYAWMLSARWNLSAEFGLGLWYMQDTKYNYYQDPWKDKVIWHYRRVVVAPTRAEVSFSYLF